MLNSIGLELASELAELLKSKNMTIATAESCTGGMASSLFCTIPGASSWFLGSIVSYSNSVKNKLLGVDNKTLLCHGAVSKETAIEMARGVQKAIESNCAFSITGIAGPLGGTEAKPVGTVWFGFIIDGKIATECCLFKGDREDIREQAVVFAIKKTISLLRT